MYMYVCIVLVLYMYLLMYPRSVLLSVCCDEHTSTLISAAPLPAPCAAGVILSLCLEVATLLFADNGGTLNAAGFGVCGTVCVGGREEHSAT